jgi:hypothetical protein
MQPSDLLGKYYALEDQIGSSPLGGELYAQPVSSPRDGRGTMQFSWTSPEMHIQWQ